MRVGCSECKKMHLARCDACTAVEESLPSPVYFMFHPFPRYQDGQEWPRLRGVFELSDHVRDHCAVQKWLSKRTVSKSRQVQGEYGFAYVHASAFTGVYLGPRCSRLPCASCSSSSSIRQPRLSCFPSTYPNSNCSVLRSICSKPECVPSSCFTLHPSIRQFYYSIHKVPTGAGRSDRSDACAVGASICEPVF
ncbi:hypothetical protein BCR44DRAFT_321072 [Catenaria anguillulae PL171]|uniref:Uncharacterized protein n=1 Tax=Catenaria anguillulae PL171 TaxID=765915 RepID=A0A1Y2HP88_9FUNG|nr:hypothetical protein BCR44DRAFT_321072 [Catenaria anguillulae PL171]